MSLLNLIVQPDCAYVITDSGHYDAERGGVVTRLGPKSVVMEDIGLVIACAGKLQCAHLSKGLASLRGLTQDEVVGFLPEIARAAVDTYKVDMLSTVVFAGFCRVRGRAFGGAFLTHVHGGPSALPKGQSYQVLDRSALLLPPLQGYELAKLRELRSYRELAGIVDLQRRSDFSSPGKPMGCCIAGDIDVVRVSAEGVSVETIISYPATIGEKVTVERTALDEWLEANTAA